MSKFENSWDLIKASSQVLKANKKLIILPIISTFLILVLTAALLLPPVLSGDLGSRGKVFNSLNSFLYIFLFYFVSYSITIFSNSVIIKAALAYLNGEEVSIGECVRSSFNKIGILLGYALIASTVGLVLKIINDKAGILGKIFTFIGSIAWNVTTFLVVPVLVTENIGPIEAIKRSGQLLKKTWGENLIGNISIGFLFGMVFLGLVIIAAPVLVVLTVKGKLAATLTIGGVFILMGMLLMLLTSTLTTIYTAALYRFANLGDAGSIFPKEFMEDAFERK